jgi:hypothetical protein
MLAAVLAALSLAAPPEAPDAGKAARPRTVAGTVAEVSLAGARVGLDAPEGRLELCLDRNTLVLLEARQGTVLDLAPGLSARASVGPKGEAYWIEILPKGAAPPAATPTPTSPPPSGPPGR